MITGWWFIALFAFLTILSYFEIRNNHKFAKFIYAWGFPFGSFVWEDLFIFSIYGLIASIIATSTHQTRLGLLFLVVFWIVRSGGEAGYFFLQQFIQPSHYPHNVDDHFQLIRFIFGDISYQQCLIVLQVFFQIILMFSISALVLLLFTWNSLV